MPLPVFQIQTNSAAVSGHSLRLFILGGVGLKVKEVFLQMILVQIAFIRALRRDCMLQPFLDKKQ